VLRTSRRELHLKAVGRVLRCQRRFHRAHSGRAIRYKSGHAHAFALRAFHYYRSRSVTRCFANGCCSDLSLFHQNEWSKIVGGLHLLSMTEREVWLRSQAPGTRRHGELLNAPQGSSIYSYLSIPKPCRYNLPW
jgi:hypothetical protein